MVVPGPYSASSFSWGVVCFLCLLCVWVKPLAGYLSVLWNTPTRASSDYFKHWTLQGRKEVWVQWVRTLLWMGAPDLRQWLLGTVATCETQSASPPRFAQRACPCCVQVILAGLRQPTGLCSFQGNFKDAVLGSHGEVGQGHIKGRQNLPCPPLIFRL